MVFLMLGKFASFSIRTSFFLSVLLLIGCIACNRADVTTQHTTWKDYGGGPDQSKYVVAEDINKNTVGQLQIAWAYSTGDEKTYQWNPIVVDTTMYVLAKNNSLVALNAKTGKEIWIHANLRGIADKGINYWESTDRKDRRLLFQMNGYLQAINALTGKSILTFGNKGLVDLKVGLGRDPKTIARVHANGPGVVERMFLV